jgi:glycosyltransferase involved in cell wall biosynthesis
VALVHNLASEQPGAGLRALKAALERRFLAGVDAAVAVCERTLAGVRALAGDALPGLVARAGRDHVAPDVDDAAVDRRSHAPGPLRVLHLASVVPAKGLHRLLRALAALAARHPRRDFTLDVAGATPSAAYARAVGRQAARVGLAGRVRLHGQLRGAALHALCRQSHVMALPSDREAYSLACLEALGFGLPVLATAAGGLGEMLTHGREGALLDPDDGDAWTDALDRLASDRGALAVMGRAALARYRAHATWREVALSVQQFLETLRPGPRPAAPGGR